VRFCERGGQGRQPLLDSFARQGDASLELSRASFAAPGGGRERPAREESEGGPDEGKANPACGLRTGSFRSRKEKFLERFEKAAGMGQERRRRAE